MTSPESLAPDEDLERATASVQWSTPAFSRGMVAMTALWGANFAHGAASHSALVEATVDLNGTSVPFARVEWVQKLGHDLVLTDGSETRFDVFMASLGYVHRLPALGPIVPALGLRVNAGAVPASVEPAYGTRLPVGAYVYLLLQPKKMEHAHQE